MMMDMMFSEMDMNKTTSTTGMNMNNSSMNSTPPMQMDQELEIVIMNAMMMGVTNQGTLNCTSDLGPDIQKYKIDPYKPMLPTSNFTFGPNFIGLFDFPNVGNWRAFFYFKLQIGNETRLLVPDFSFASVTSPNTPTLSPAPTRAPTRAPTTPPKVTDTNGNHDGSSVGMIVAIAVVITALVAFVITAGYFYHKNGHLFGMTITKKGIQPVRADDYVAFTGT